jgi:hypothetical protein
MIKGLIFAVENFSVFEKTAIGIRKAWFPDAN